MERKPRCYTIGPFRAGTELARRINIARAEQAALELARIGFHYRCPHLHSIHFDGQLDDTYWLGLGLDLLSECDAAYLVPDESPVFVRRTGIVFQRSWLDPHCVTYSSGSAAEVAWCYAHHLPVFTTSGEAQRFAEKWQKKVE